MQHYAAAQQEGGGRAWRRRCVCAQWSLKLFIFIYYSHPHYIHLQFVLCKQPSTPPPNPKWCPFNAEYDLLPNRRDDSNEPSLVTRNQG
jgi:hypothetical protein